MYRKNVFSNFKHDLPTLFERTASEVGIFQKLIRPYTPRHSGKVERSHRKDQKRFSATTASTPSLILADS